MSLQFNNTNMAQVFLTCVCFTASLFDLRKGKGIAILLSLLPFVVTAKGKITPADAFPDNYCSFLKGERTALIINQTSTVGDSSLLDIVRTRGINVVKIFVPEHGFRGKEDAGAHIDNSVDSATGIKVISLYGNHKKPTAEDLQDVDIMVYDLQDVGARFYTYISTLEYCMEACATAHKQFMILDRPNPNGFYVDGPVLEKQNKSFVGMQAIPVVYGMTVAEYARMLVGERWFQGAASLDLLVQKCKNYDHSDHYILPVAPSPNLRTIQAIYAYPSLCFFEGTVISVGRGTDKPFEQFGAPELEGKFPYVFTPVSGLGAKSPLYENKKCYGQIVGSAPEEVLKKTIGKLQMGWVIDAYKAYPQKDKFFNDFFIKLSGTTRLQEQIKNGESPEAIRQSWQKDIKAFKKIRKKYLLYPL